MNNKKIIRGFKATDKDGKCQGFQYEVGQEYSINGKMKICENGFHFCKNAHDVLNYYNGHDCRYFEIESNGEIIEDGDKCVTNKIKIIKEITKSELLQNTLKPKKILKKLNSTTGAWAHSSTTGAWAHSSTTGNYAHSSTTGDDAHSSTTGNYAHSSTTGDDAHSSTTGDRAHSSTTGYEANSSTTGFEAHSSTTGAWAHSSTTGNYAHSSTTGDYSNSSTTGNYAHSSTTGYEAHSSTTGNYAHSSTTGDDAHSSTTGDRAHSSTTGYEAISCSLGINGRAKAENGHIIIVDWRFKDKWKINKIYTAKIGQKICNVIIKSNTWYWFENGKLKKEKVQ